MFLEPFGLNNHSSTVTAQGTRNDTAARVRATYPGLQVWCGCWGRSDCCAHMRGVAWRCAAQPVSGGRFGAFALVASRSPSPWPPRRRPHRAHLAPIRAPPRMRDNRPAGLLCPGGRALPHHPGGDLADGRAVAPRRRRALRAVRGCPSLLLDTGPAIGDGFVEPLGARAPGGRPRGGARRGTRMLRQEHRRLGSLCEWRARPAAVGRHSLWLVSWFGKLVLQPSVRWPRFTSSAPPPPRRRPQQPAAAAAPAARPAAARRRSSGRRPQPPLLLGCRAA
mgnify:CR=1 FL=1